MYVFLELPEQCKKARVFLATKDDATRVTLHLGRLFTLANKLGFNIAHGLSCTYDQ
jgi:polysaccharide deacetylase 2 family uncharacterized protein YibQ